MNKFFKVTLFSALYTLLKMVAGFIIGKIVAVNTGPTGIATLGQLQGIVNILNGIVTAPVGSGVVRYTAVNRDEGLESCAPWWRASIRVSLCIYIFLLITILVCSKQIAQYFFGSEYYKWLIVFASVILPLSIINTFLASILNGLQKYKKYIFLGMLSVSLSTLMIVVFVLKFSLWGGLIATCMNTSLAGILLLLFCRKEIWFRWGHFFGTAHNENLKGILNFSLMAFVTAISTPVALLFVRNILIRDTGWQEAGEWQAVWKISEVYLSVMTMALSTYFLPRLASLKTSYKIKKEVNSLSVYIVIVTLCMSAIVYLLRDIIITILFTSDFKNARDLFFYQLIGDILKISGFLYAYPMIAQGRVKTFIISEIIFAVSFVCLVDVFVKYHGVQGANLGYMFNYCAYFIFAFIFTNYFNVKIDHKFNG
ncbi:O-antigen translocase [Lelliottia wanjuensis]|uniref:O-antigen translocase n=1 Tax=Lelliottia wanjuensis TaxID=3050585 RepID=UPI00254C1877|nr:MULTISPECIES: O-antigen translocase [unclassified Lelliottia]MDK9356980.1 O-antigen translocase [Lelliottia sp. V106_16]MDK9372348.1 O-antigen translocase [Lelliottia sp. V106_10]MDK9585687.1 O-antigen translocase [Lelliottia sp. V86_10]MDK9599152.1 O-antigen translocase [Lelliottia sp. V106_5]